MDDGGDMWIHLWLLEEGTGWMGKCHLYVGGERGWRRPERMWRSGQWLWVGRSKSKRAAVAEGIIEI